MELCVAMAWGSEGVVEIFLQVLCRIAFCVLHDLLGRTCLEQASSATAALGTHVDDVVGHLDDVEVVLDDDDRVALVDQALEHAHQDADVLEVEPRGGLVEDVEGVARVALGELGGELHALALAAREGRGGLAQLDVAEADLLQHLYLVEDGGHVLKELYGAIDGHVEHIGDGLASVAHLEGLVIVPLATAYLAGDEHVGQEVHLHILVPVAKACLAATATDVEGEAAGLVAAYLGFGEGDEEVADIAEHARIGGGVGAWRAPQRGLVYGDDLVDMLEPLDALVGQRLAQRAVEVPGEDGLQGVVDERRLAAPAHTRDADECAEGEVHVDPFEVVARGAPEADHLAVAPAALGGDLDAHLSIEVLRGEGMGT